MTSSGDKGIVPAAGLAALKLHSRIFELRGVHVMLDSDLAELYEVETGALNQAVKRNAERFPADFVFQLTAEEVENLKSQFVISSSEHGGRRRSRPYAFTEQGVAMLSGVLRSGRAVQVNIAIMRAFVELRRWARSNEELARKLATLERKSDEQYRQVMQVIERLVAPPSAPAKRIGFDKPKGRTR